MPAASKEQPTSFSLGKASSVPASALGRVGEEMGSIWKDARALSRRGVTIPERKALSADVVYAGWYAGMAGMVALNVIEWQLAAVIGAVHTVERYGRRQTVRELAAGLEAGI